MRKSSNNILLAVIILMVFSGCNKFKKIQKSDDWRVKYEAALAYYEKEDYYRSTILFEDIMPFVRGTEEAEKIQFYYAYAHFHQKQYLLSSDYFKRFYDTYNRSSFAQESYYMYAYSLYMQSPRYNLDQTSSVEAIAAMQAFINKYPYSEYKDEATEIIDLLQHKLEKKAYENAKQYYDLGYYRAADIAFESFENEYPDSELVEQTRYLRIVTVYDMAKKSIISKQLERYRKCIELYEEFVDTYPQSEHLKELQNVYSNSIAQIEKMNQEFL